MNKQSADEKNIEQVPDAEAFTILAVILIGGPAAGLLYAHFGINESLMIVLLIIIALALVVGFFRLMLSPISRFID